MAQDLMHEIFLRAREEEEAERQLRLPNGADRAAMPLGPNVNRFVGGVKSIADGLGARHETAMQGIRAKGAPASENEARRIVDGLIARIQGAVPQGVKDFEPLTFIQTGQTKGLEMSPSLGQIAGAMLPQSADELPLEFLPFDEVIGPAARAIAKKLPAIKWVDDLGPGVAADASEDTVRISRKEFGSLPREERAKVIRHELAHSVDKKDELWKEWDTEMWKLWEEDKNHPVFLWMSEQPRISRFEMDSDISPEVMAEMYANAYEDGVLRYFDSSLPAVGDNVNIPNAEFEIPEELMSVLDKIEEKTGVFEKRARRARN